MYRFFFIFSTVKFVGDVCGVSMCHFVCLCKFVSFFCSSSFLDKNKKNLDFSDFTQGLGKIFLDSSRWVGGLRTLY